MSDDTLMDFSDEAEGEEAAAETDDKWGFAKGEEDGVKCERCANLARLLANERKAHESTKGLLTGQRSTASSAQSRVRVLDKLIADASALSPAAADALVAASKVRGGDEVAAGVARGAQRRQDNRR